MFLPSGHRRIECKRLFRLGQASKSRVLDGLNFLFQVTLNGLALTVVLNDVLSSDLPAYLRG